MSPLNIAHGAALVAIADSAMGYAAFSLMPPGADTATFELKINYLAPAVGDRMVARGRVVKAGRRTIVTQADVFAETAGREKLVGLVTATFIVAQGGTISDGAMSALPPKADMCGATSDFPYGPIADIFDAFQLAIFDDLADQVVALRTLKGAFIVCRFVRLNPRKPHRRSAFPTNRQIENKAGRIEDIFRLRHRSCPSYGRGSSAPCVGKAHRR